MVYSETILKAITPSLQSLCDELDLQVKFDGTYRVFVKGVSYLHIEHWGGGQKPSSMESFLSRFIRLERVNHPSMFRLKSALPEGELRRLAEYVNH